MKKLRYVKIVFLVILVLGGGFLTLNFIQQSINSYFNPPEAIDIHNLHPNDVASPTVFDFREEMETREYLLDSITQEVTYQEYREIIFDISNAQRENQGTIDITLLGIILLVVIIVVVTFTFTRLREYQE